MKLAKVWVKNYRSINSDSDGALELDLVDGMNVLVGQNNCGKSNLLSAIALAMDPSHEFNRTRDLPATMAFAYPRITLVFQCEGRTSPEKTLLRYAEEYERSVVGRGKPLYATGGELRFVVTYPGNQQTGATRREFFQAKGAGNRSEDGELSARLIRKFRETCRFALVRSGESLESLLGGRFRDILHMVIRDHLSAEMGKAEIARVEYVQSLQKSLLAPLSGSIENLVRVVFPEIRATMLTPKVPAIDETLSNVGISLVDNAETELSSKGTGVRGGVLIAMLRYLAEQTRRSMVLAVEEPEAFLHPSAQEALRTDLEQLARRSDVTLLVTTHSPFIVSQQPSAQVIALKKDSDGRTAVTGTALGSEPNSTLLGNLFRDAAVAGILERVSSIPDTAKAVLVVEGQTDEDYLRIACDKAGRSDLLEGVHFSVAGGANKVVLQAILLRGYTNKPVIALFDSDTPGREAKKKLCELANLSDKKEVVTYGKFCPKWQDVEAEDLWPSSLLDRFVTEVGPVVLQEKSRRKDGTWHIGLTYQGKDLIADWLRRRASSADSRNFVAVVEEISARLGQMVSA